MTAADKAREQLKEEEEQDNGKATSGDDPAAQAQALAEYAKSVAEAADVVNGGNPADQPEENLL